MLDCMNQGADLGKQQALKLKKASEQKILNPEMTDHILQKTEGKKTITLSAQKVREYFPDQYSKEQIETIIYKLLDTWKKEGGT